MKKVYLTLLMLIPFLGKSQTITTADLPTAGLAWITGNDSTYVQPIASGGTGQIWNYSGLQNLENDTIGFINASGTPYYALFPGSNLAGYDRTSDTYSYFTTNSSGMYINGIANASTVLSYNTSQLYIPVPFSYGDVRDTYSRIQIDTVYSGNNVRLIIRTNSTFEADGTGDLTLPSGQFNGVLRVKETALTFDSLLMDVGGGIYIPLSNSASQVTRFSYLKPGNAVALLLQIEADSLGQYSTSSSYFTGTFVSGIFNSPKTTSVSTYPNPASSTVNMDLTSLNDLSSIEIFDLKGNKVMTVEPSKNGITSFSTSELANGLYHFSVKGKNVNYSGNIQIQH